ncbi:MAG: hypothetical protein F6K55_07075 [Moorea sp. SIO4A3]|nr:hypothetical protein [Moorena sp. SIO4A3]
MKGKIFNYLVIIGVSIILLLGIVTTAFGQDYLKFHDTTINFAKGCEEYEYNVPIRHRDSNNKDSPIIGCIKEGTYVEITEDNSKDTNLDFFYPIKIKGNYHSNNFLIENNFLKNCPKKSLGKFCETSKQQ